MNYGKGGGVTATGSGFADKRTGPVKKTGKEIPWMKVMIAVIAVILLGVAYLVLSGYPVR